MTDKLHEICVEPQPHEPTYPRRLPQSYMGLSADEVLPRLASLGYKFEGVDFGSLLAKVAEDDYDLGRLTRAGSSPRVLAYAPARRLYARSTQ